MVHVHLNVPQDVRQIVISIVQRSVRTHVPTLVQTPVQNHVVAVQTFAIHV